MQRDGKNLKALHSFILKDNESKWKKTNAKCNKEVIKLT